MKNNGGFKDVNKTSAIAGLGVLVILIIVLIAVTIVVGIHTNKYLDYEQGKIVENDIKLTGSEACDLGTLKKAQKSAASLAVSVEVKDLKLNNIDAEGNCIRKEFGMDECEKTRDYTAALVTIKNIKKEYELEITNDFDSSILTINSNGEKIIAGRTDESNDVEYEVTNDSYSFVAYNQHRIINYTMYVFYTERDCSRVLVRKITFETPQYNFLSRTTACEGKEDLPNCKKYLYSDNPLTKSEFDLSGILLDIEKNKSSEKRLENIKSALVVACVIAIILLVISIVVTVVGVKKVRKGGVLHENEIDEDYDEDKSDAYEEYEQSKEEDEASDEKE